jgi:TolA-binding protein
MKESKKWSEEISQRQHQYALQKFNELENKIRQLEKKIMSFENKSCQEKNQENIFANIKHLTENLIPLDIEKLCKLADPVKILDIDNVNKTTEKPKDIELDNDNLDDDENMFVIINE